MTVLFDTPAPTRKHLNMKLGKAFTLTLSIVSAVVGLIAAFYGLLVTSWTVASPVDGSFGFTVPVATPAENRFDTQFSSDQLRVMYDGGTWIEADAPLILPRVLIGIATALPFFIVIAGCIGTMVLALKFAQPRPFNAALGRVIGIVGLVVAATAVLVPALTSLAVENAVAQLGLPTSGDDVANLDADSWVVPGSFDVLQDLDWPFLLLGVVLILVAALLGRATRLQRDSEGLV